jgi:hypothetical protein
LSETSEHARHFEPIHDAGQAVRFLREAGKTFASTMVWTKEQEIVVHSQISLVSEAGSLITVGCPKGFNPRTLVEFMATHGQTDCYFSVSLQRASIFFRAKFNGASDTGLSFEFPKTLYKVQRRNDLRYPIPYGHVMKIDLQDPLFPEKTLTWKAADISARGCAILIPDAESSSYPVGLTLRNLRFSIQGRRIEVPAAEVRHKRMLPPTGDGAPGRGPGVKLGLLFKQIRETDSQHIAAYVFEESRRFFSLLG